MQEICKTIETESKGAVGHTWNNHLGGRKAGKSGTMSFKQPGLHKTLTQS